MAGFKITAGAKRAGWIPAAGDAVRAIGNAIGALMLPPASPAFRVAAPPLFRIRVGARVCSLEKRVHATPTRRCSVGRWERQDSGPTPRNARAWGKLAKFWAWYAVEVSEGRNPYSWTADRGKSPNRCITPANANAHQPTQAIGSCGRGRVGKVIPTRAEVFGHSPARGVKLVQTVADERAARTHRRRIARRERMALRRNAR